jgi:hypothetical protein
MTHLSGMRNEARQVLQRAQPATIGQASRLAGMTLADISLLILAIEQRTPCPTTRCNQQMTLHQMAIDYAGALHQA